MKSFNNWVKAALINKYVEKLPLLKPRKPSVLEICSGKGGDFVKWTRHNPSHYVAVEKQEKLIDEAISRRNSLDWPIKFPTIYLVADPGDEKFKIDKMLVKEEFCGTIKK